MLRRGFIAAVLLATVVTACSDDGDSKSAATGAPVASDSPAPVATGDGSSGAAVDCGVLAPLVASAGVNIQLIVQLATIPDVANWTLSIGSMPQFGDQLAAMAVLIPFDDGVAEQLAFFQGANEIVQRGLAGDATAPADLAAVLGDDISATLSRQIPFGMAMEAAGC
jgi:hypothetical protein